MKCLRAIPIVVAFFATVASGWALAQQPTQQAVVPGPQQPSTQSALQVMTADYPPGYISLILDLQGIELRMTLEQKLGKGDHWPQWLRPGLAEGNSLYWWMLAKWHHNAGNKDIAYRSLMTAWVLTRMENRMCPSRDASLATRILRIHQDILEAGTTEPKLKHEAVLYALSMANSFISKGIPLRAMSCNIDPARRAMEDQRKQLETWRKDAAEAAENGRKPPVWRPAKTRTLIDYRVGKEPDEMARAVAQQFKELNAATSDLNGDQARERADINTIMRTLDSTKATN